MPRRMQMNTYENRVERYRAILSRVEKSCDSDVIQLTDGTKLIGKLKPRADGLFSKAYMHSIYSGLSEDSIRDLANMIGRHLPEPLMDFYRAANGLSLFCGSLSISGLRVDYSRNPEVRLPVSLEYGNTLELPKGSDTYAATERPISLGFYSWGKGAHVFLDPTSFGVWLAPRNHLSPILYQWASLEYFLEHEIERMTAASKNIDLSPLVVIPPVVDSTRQ